MADLERCRTGPRAFEFFALERVPGATADAKPLGDCQSGEGWRDAFTLVYLVASAGAAHRSGSPRNFRMDPDGEVAFDRCEIGRQGLRNSAAGQNDPIVGFRASIGWRRWNSRPRLIIAEI